MSVGSIVTSDFSQKVCALMSLNTHGTTQCTNRFFYIIYQRVGFMGQMDPWVSITSMQVGSLRNSYWDGARALNSIRNASLPLAIMHYYWIWEFSAAKIWHMQLQATHKGIQSTLELGARVIKGCHQWRAVSSMTAKRRHHCRSSSYPFSMLGSCRNRRLEKQSKVFVFVASWVAGSFDTWQVPSSKYFLKGMRTSWSQNGIECVENPWANNRATLTTMCSTLPESGSGMNLLASVAFKKRFPILWESRLPLQDVNSMLSEWKCSVLSHTQEAFGSDDLIVQQLSWIVYPRELPHGRYRW